MASVDNNRDPNASVKGLVVAAAGSIFMVFFILHMVRTFFGSSGILELLNVPSDPVIGLVMLIVSILLIIGGFNYLSEGGDGIAFALIGSFMGILISVVGILQLLSNAFTVHILGSSDLTGWKITDGVVPGLYLGIIVILILPFILSGRDSKTDQVGSVGGGKV